MSNYNNLKTSIDANIKQNGNQEITGPILNSVLNQMVNILGTGYQFAGVATLDPATDPGTPDAKVFYIANGKGTYTNFGSLEVTEDEVVVLYWDSAWHKVSTGIASQAKLSELVNSFGVGYMFMGVATEGTNPGTPDQKIFYVATEGIFPNFGGIKIGKGVIGFLKWDEEWSLDTISGIGGGSDILQVANVVEDGLFFVDSSLNIGAQLTQDGFSSFLY